MTTNAEVKVRIHTEAGPLVIVGTARGVSEIYFERPERARNVSRPDATSMPTAIPDPVRRAVEQLEQYFRGDRIEFKFETDYAGTEFQRRVWSHLLTIPSGETRTYGEVARAIGSPKGARAVGGAVGSNPISIAIPCHRVVGADGKDGGYGGGMAAKRYLLQLEAARLENGEGSIR